MGVVVAAHHLQLDEKVALKFLLPAALKNPDAVARFVREARAAVKIKSEHVARVSDVGQLDGGSPYMVMEYLEGVDLAAWLKQRGPMAVEQAVEFVLQACEAIAEAHALGIVHRDLKPANLFCVRRADGLLSVKVLDFGISKLIVPGGEKQEMTRTSVVLGSPLYMSPEQVVSSKGVDPRTDLWSLGVILFELVSGRVPFEAEAVTELVVKIATCPPLALRAFHQDLPPGFEPLVMRCLEKERERRFQNVAELAIALCQYGPGRAKGSVERILRTMQAAGLSQAVLPASGHSPAAIAPSLPAATDATWGTTGAGRKKGSAAFVIGLVATAGTLAVAAVVGGVLLSRSHRPSAAPGASMVASASLLVGSPTPESEVPAASAVPPTSPLPSVTPSVLGVDAAPEPVATPAALTARPPAAPPTPQHAQPAAPKPRANCDPPFAIDSNGHRVPKPECM